VPDANDELSDLRATAEIVSLSKSSARGRRLADVYIPIRKQDAFLPRGAPVHRAPTTMRRALVQPFTVALSTTAPKANGLSGIKRMKGDSDGSERGVRGRADGWPDRLKAAAGGPL
jgi:hypothetical protein